MDHLKNYYLRLLQASHLRDLKIAKYSGFMLGFSACGRVLYLGLMFYTGYFVVHKRMGIDLEPVLVSSMISFVAMIGVGSQI